MSNTLGFDFDGVLHEHRGFTVPMGAVDVSLLVQALEQGWFAVVITANLPEYVAQTLRDHGIDAVPDNKMAYGEWHGGRGGKQVLVTNRKVHCAMFIDDRAFQFLYGQPNSRVFNELARRGLSPRVSA